MYYIYEIPGVKVGCTKDFERRQNEQRDKGEMLVLEEYTNIEEASRREKELQVEKGYRVEDKDYMTLNTMREKALSEESLKKRSESRKGQYNSGLQAYNNSKKKPVDVYKVILHKRKIIKEIYVCTYESVTMTAKKHNIPTAYVRHILDPKLCAKTSKGYTFKYA